MFENHRALGSRNLHAPRISGISRSRGLQSPQRAAGKFENGERSIFRLNRVKYRCRARLHAHHIPEQPQQQIDGVHRLVDERAPAVQRGRPTPARAAVVFRRPVPFHLRIHHQRFAEDAGADPVAEFSDSGFHAVLKHHAKLHAGALPPLRSARPLVRC